MTWNTAQVYRKTPLKDLTLPVFQFMELKICFYFSLDCQGKSELMHDMKSSSVGHLYIILLHGKSL